MPTITTFKCSYSASVNATKLDDFEGSGIDTALAAKFRASANLTANTTPAVQAVWANDLALVAGAFVLHLDATAASAGVSGLVGAPVADSDFTGYALQVMAFETPGGTSGNTAVVTVEPGIANPYILFGSADDKFTLGPGGSLVYYAANQLADVSASAKEIDIAGTGTELLFVALAAG